MNMKKKTKIFKEDDIVKVPYNGHQIFGQINEINEDKKLAYVYFEIVTDTDTKLLFGELVVPFSEIIKTCKKDYRKCIQYNYI